MTSNEEVKKNGYCYPMDEAKEMITPELANAFKEINQIANQGYVYGQQTVMQSLSDFVPDEKAQRKLKAMLGGADIISEKG